MPAGRNTDTGGGRTPLGPTQTGISRLRTILRVPRNRLLRRRGIRRLVQMVEKGVQATAFIRLTDPGGSQVVQWSWGLQWSSVKPPHAQDRSRLYRPDDPNPPVPR